MTPQMKIFYQRLRRIARIHRQGGGFEAAGTLGQSYYTRMAQRNARPVLRPILYIVGAAVMSKAALLAAHGPEDYARRVIDLQNGTPVEQAGAFLMGADPVTLRIAEALMPLFRS